MSSRETGKRCDRLPIVSTDYTYMNLQYYYYYFLFVGLGGVVVEKRMFSCMRDTHE